VELPAAEDELAVAPAQLHHVAGARVAQRKLGEIFDGVVRAWTVERLRHPDLLVRARDFRMAGGALPVVNVAGSGRNESESKKGEGETRNVQCSMLNVEC